MSVNLRYPHITALSEKEQIAQIKSYLHQLVEQLNWALPNLGSEEGTTQTISSQNNEEQDSGMTYYELRSLVIQKLQEVQNLVDRLEAGYVKNSGWATDRHLITDANGNVTARKLTFTLDEDGNLYYELEE